MNFKAIEKGCYLGLLGGAVMCLIGEKAPAQFLGALLIVSSTFILSALIIGHAIACKSNSAKDVK